MTADLLEQPLLAVDDVEDSFDEIGEEYYPTEYRITSYGADYDVDGLVRRMTNGTIEIPEFQRGYVWSIFEASRFIESLLIGLPVPAIFFSREETQRFLVIDGQQRLKTLLYFYEGVFQPTQKAFALRGVHRHYEGKTYATLEDRDRRKLDDSIIHAIIVKQEGPPEESPSSVFHIFERLNTGGVKLKPQEIRSAVYHGEFSKLLAELNRDSNWRLLFGPQSKDMRDQELILRFFALLYDADGYEKPMKEFLNWFMFRNRQLQRFPANLLYQIFWRTTKTIAETIGPQAFKPKRAVNAALCDAVMVGVARRFVKGEVKKPDQFAEKFRELLKSESFQSAINSATTDEENLRHRLKTATDVFGKVR